MQDNFDYKAYLKNNPLLSEIKINNPAFKFTDNDKLFKFFSDEKNQKYRDELVDNILDKMGVDRGEWDYVEEGWKEGKVIKKNTLVEFEEEFYGDDLLISLNSIGNLENKINFYDNIIYYKFRGE